MFAKPQSEHKWLDQLLGNWIVEQECEMPDGTKSKTVGKMACRSVGGLWLISEIEAKTPDGEKWSSIMTFGFDPAENRYVGTFVASVMANIWHYQGVMDPNGKRLPLFTTGPKLDGEGTANYRDTIEIVDADLWMYTSELETDDGQWIKFMDAKHSRD